MKPLQIVAGAVVAWGVYVAWTMYRDNQQGASDSGDGWLSGVDSILNQPLQGAAEFIDSLGVSMLKISNMGTVDKALVNHPNVRAALVMIRVGEGTNDANGYRRMFGGELFEGFADHPRKLVKKSGYSSTAAGAYQALESTWDETKRIMNLPDFSPASQDLFALGRIAARGALDAVVRGDLNAALPRLGREWASLPGSPYGQPTISKQRAAQVFALAGGISSSTVA
jgi:muramidase (phage lysozyme)